MTNAPTIWTPERIAELRRLFDLHISITQIAARLDCGVSRSAVIGKLHRLGLRREKPKAEKRVRAGSLAAGVITRLRSQAEGTAAPIVPFTPRADTAIPLHVDLLDLKLGMCRWPYGEGPFTFCGCQAPELSPYCEPHARLSRPAALSKERAEQLRKRGQQLSMRAKVARRWAA